MNKPIIIYDFFNDADLELLLNSPEVLDNFQVFQSRFASTNKQTKQNFSITLPADSSILDKLAIQGSANEVPMRWTNEEVGEHIDKSQDGAAFHMTILIYLTDDHNAVLNIDGIEYSIQKNTAFMFPPNLLHSVRHLDETTSSPRLMIGPMSEYMQSVGCLGYAYFSTIDEANLGTANIYYSCVGDPIPTPEEAGLTIPPGNTFMGWMLAPDHFKTTPLDTNGFPNDQLYLAGEIYQDPTYQSFNNYNLYPVYSSVPNLYSQGHCYLIGNKSGSFWYGKPDGFPGFLYKKNVGVGARRSTRLGAAGNAIAPYAYLYNKYKPGTGGVGASSVANRRAKARLASVCSPTEHCGKFYPFLGRYSNYTENPNGYFTAPQNSAFWNTNK
jgi:hypothetical protein